MTKRNRAHSLSAVLVVVSALVALIAVFGTAAERRAPLPAVDEPLVAAVLTEDAGGLRFTYHVPTGTEALYDLREDPGARRNILESRPEDARVLRLLLRKRLGVHDLGDLRSSRKRQIEELKALGYL